MKFIVDFQAGPFSVKSGEAGTMEVSGHAVSSIPSRTVPPYPTPQRDLPTRSPSDSSGSGFYGVRSPRFWLGWAAIALLIMSWYWSRKRKARQYPPTAAGAGPPCPRCGIGTFPGAKFCARCGTTLAGARSF